MSFLTPLFLLLGLLAGPIILLYMLRLRRREMLVSSTMLWQKLLRDREANAPWQKLRRNLLLILQLIILAALVFALARPFIPVPSVISGSVVVILDASASMQATDVEPSRFEVAQAEVGQWINELGAGDQMTLILAGQSPRVLTAATNDRANLRGALADARPGSAESDWSAAFALASGAAQGFRDARIIVVSDGGLPDDLPPLPAETVYVPVGESAENIGLTALATRDTLDGPQLFASITNYGALPQNALLSLSLDGSLFDSRRIDAPAGGTTTLTWNLPEEVSTIEATISEQTQDFFPPDDRAWAVHEGGVSNRALLVTPGNIFLEQIYGVLPGIEAFKAPPDVDLTVDEEPFALYVLDSVPLPAELPQGDLLIINPLATGDEESPLLSISGIFSETTVTGLTDSPLMQFVDWGDVSVRRAKSIAAPWAQPVLSATGGGLILSGERNGFRIVVMTFDLHDSDLPLRIAFPVLMANITNWLSPGRAFDVPTGLQLSDPVSLSPAAGTTVILVDKPDQERWTADVGEEEIIFSETDQLGLYTVRLRDSEGDRPAGSFAVNLFSPIESHIEPVPAIQLGQIQPESAEEAGNIGQREFWPWLAALAFLILVVEWWVHHRGTRLPKVGDFRRGK